MTLDKFTYYKIDHLTNKFPSSVSGMKTLEKKLCILITLLQITLNLIKFIVVAMNQIKFDKYYLTIWWQQYNYDNTTNNEKSYL